MQVIRVKSHQSYLNGWCLCSNVHAHPVCSSSITTLWTPPWEPLADDSVNLRMVSLTDWYLFTKEPKDQQGKSLWITARRNKMYIHGSKIWLQVANRSQSRRDFLWSCPPDSTVFAINTWWRRKCGRDKGRRWCWMLVTETESGWEKGVGGWDWCNGEGHRRDN